MATYTTNYNLKKPADSDFINVADFNGNADIIDAELKKRPAVGEDGKLSDDLLPDLSETYEEKGAAETAVSAHNSSTNAHNDIRIAINKKAPAPIIGTTPPTTSTVGIVGQTYIDTAAKLVYHCTGVSTSTAAAQSMHPVVQASGGGNTVYTWEVYSAGRSTKVNTTLSASGWTTAKKYTVSNANITATSAIELLPRENSGITQAQMEALSGAMIVGGTQTAGSIQLIALGDKPTIDIPVTLIIRRDL